MEITSLIISSIGTIVGIIGLIISIKTWYNTKNIVKAVTAEKIKSIYPNKHKLFVSSLKTATLALKEGERNYYIVQDVYNTSIIIKRFYDNWEKEDRNAIDSFITFLNKICPNQDIDDKTADELLKKLFDISACLERIGELNDIG